MRKIKWCSISYFTSQMTKQWDTTTCLLKCPKSRTLTEPNAVQPNVEQQLLSLRNKSDMVILEIMCLIKKEKLNIL
jgi:hypothetical protein